MNHLLNLIDLDSPYARSNLVYTFHYIVQNYIINLVYQTTACHRKVYTFFWWEFIIDVLLRSARCIIACVVHGSTCCGMYPR
jgi:hypothetical protein